MNAIFLFTAAVVLSIAAPPVAHSHDDDDDNASSAQSYSEETGLKISEASEKRIGIQVAPVTVGASGIEVPTSSLIFHQTEVGVYRSNDAHYKLVDVELVKTTGSKTLIRSKALRSGDKIVIKGAALLRVVETAAKSGIEGE